VEKRQLGVGWGDFVDFVDDEPEDDESLDDDEESLDEEEESLEEDDESLEDDDEDDADAGSVVDCLPRLSFR
jgi:Ran GTPase-activating protein (RanGAP) involved in mRNA processing and transport